ncbi:MAG: hypothetical protein GBAus27B_000105 [Mycoplasmataceae bacterium]|nr:MAG: hypothetical protein GBAus27B_000105 [Mycoplasmataceae bacterium]
MEKYYSNWREEILNFHCKREVVDYEDIFKKAVDSLVEFDKEHRADKLPSNEPNEIQQQRIENIISQSTNNQSNTNNLDIQAIVKQKAHPIFQKAVQLARFPNWKVKFKN